MLNWDNRNFQYLVLVVLALIWGSSFLLMKIGLEAMDYKEVALWRLFIAFLFLLILFFKRFKEFQWKYTIPLLLVAVFGNGLPAFLFTKAETVIDSSVAGVLNSLVPLFTAIIGLIFFKVRIRWYNAFGILIGFGGAILLFIDELRIENSQQLLYAIFPVLAAMSYAISLNTIKHRLQELSALAITTIAFTMVGPFSGIGLYTQGYIDRLSIAEVRVALVFVVLLAVLGTALALLIFNKLVKHTTALFASSVTYLIPIVAIIWGVIYGENIGFNHFLGLNTILAGVWLVTKKAT